MDVEYGLPRVCTGIHHHSKTRFRDLLLLSQVSGHEEQFPNELRIFVAHLSHGGDVFPGNDEDMRRRLGIDVPESHYIRGGPDLLSRDLS